MPACSLIYCRARRKQNSHPQLTMHRFPKNDTLRKKWLDIIGIENINPRQKARYVCSLHFHESCFNRTLDIIRLKDMAVPSLFLLGREKCVQNLELVSNVAILYERRKTEETTCLVEMHSQLPTENEQAGLKEILYHMKNVRVCAACLATDVRMYSMSAASLLEPYRLLTGIELQSEGMPQKLCWECAALVHKFNMFRHKCERASLLLQDIYNQHDEVSEQEVLRVNREQHNLISSYTICPIQVYDLSSLKTKGKRRERDNTSNPDNIVEVENTNDSQTGDARMESFIKLEHEIIKKEDDTIEVKSEVDDTELIDEVFVEEDCSQAVQMESPPKIKRVRKRRHIEPKPKSERKNTKVLAKNFRMKEELLSQEQQMALMRERQNTEGYRLSRFPCTLCYKSFSMEKAFNNHMLKHDPVAGELICDICKLRYKTRNRLCKHIRTNHMNKYSCRSCPAVFYHRSAAMKHYAWHKGVVYTCHICGASFEKQTTQLNHLRIKHPSEHVCDQCGTPFYSKKGLLRHINLMHKLKRDTVASGGEQETSGPYCAECDIQFTCKQAWTRHILISPKHRHERHICALGCYICGETLADKKSLRAHRVTHRQTPSRVKITARPITCEQCGEVMESSHWYHAHFRSAHPDKTRTHYPAMRAPCMCELCGKIFQSKAHLKEHSYKHMGEQRNTDERRYQCDVCSKRCTTKELLKVHMRSHTKEVPYKCDICRRGFSSYFNMCRHKSVHTDATPYACDICGKRFKDRRYVRLHFEYVHMKKPWPKRDRSKRLNGNETQSRDEKHSHEEAVAHARPQQEGERERKAE